MQFRGHPRALLAQRVPFGDGGGETLRQRILVAHDRRELGRGGGAFGQYLALTNAQEIAFARQHMELPAQIFQGDLVVDENAAEQLARLLEKSANLIERIERRIRRRIARQFQQSIVGAQRPLVQSRMGGERGPIGLVMDQILGEKVIYFARCSLGQARPKQIRIGGNLVANAAPVRLKFVKGENRARLGPALHLCVEIVAQPEQQSFFEGHSLLFLERLGDFQRGTNRDHDAGCLLHLPQHPEPKRRKTTNTRVFDYRQGCAAELRLEELFRAPPILRGDGRTVPAGIEETPIMPTGTRRSQEFVMKMHECDGLEIAARIARIGDHEMFGRPAAEFHQSPRNCAGAAAMHSENNDDI